MRLVASDGSSGVWLFGSVAGCLLQWWKSMLPWPTPHDRTAHPRHSWYRTLERRCHQSL